MNDPDDKRCLLMYEFTTLDPSIQNQGIGTWFYEHRETAYVDYLQEHGGRVPAVILLEHINPALAKMTFETEKGRHAFVNATNGPSLKIVLDHLAKRGALHVPIDWRCPAWKAPDIEVVQSFHNGNKIERTGSIQLEQCFSLATIFVKESAPSPQLVEQAVQAYFAATDSDVPARNRSALKMMSNQLQGQDPIYWAEQMVPVNQAKYHNPMKYRPGSFSIPPAAALKP